MSFLENSADIYGNDPIVPVFPSVTRWTAYNQVCLIFFEVQRPILHVLTVSYNKKRERGRGIRFAYPSNLTTNNCNNINAIGSS